MLRERALSRSEVGIVAREGAIAWREEAAVAREAALARREHATDAREEASRSGRRPFGQTIGLREGCFTASSLSILSPSAGSKNTKGLGRGKRPEKYIRASWF